jgi:hypothetical protein
MGEQRVMADGRIIEMGPNGVPFVVPAPGGGMTVPVGARNPKYPFERQQIQGQIAQTATNTTGQQIDNSIKGATAAPVIAKAGADAQKAGIEAKSADRLNGLPPDVYAKALAQWNASLQLDSIINDLHQKFAEGPGATHGLAGLADYLPLPQNQAFDNVGNQARGIVRNALGLTGGEANTAQEMQMNLGAYIPSASQYDGTIVNTMGNLAKVRDNARRNAIQTLGGIPDASGKITPVDSKAAPNVWNNTYLDPTQNLEAAAFGATTKQGDIPPGMQREYDAWIAQNARNLSPDAYVKFRSDLDRKYGYQVTPEQEDAYRKWAVVAANAGRGGNTIPTTIPGPAQPMSNMEFLRNSAVNNPFGASAVGLGDAASFGAISALNPDQTQALGNASTGNAIGMGLGQVAGSIAGTEGLGLGLRSLASRIAPAVLRGGEVAKMMRTLGTDTAYSGIYGNNTGADPALSALAGGFGSGLGQVGGKVTGAAIGGLAASNAIKYLRDAGIPLTAARVMGKTASRIEDAAMSLPGVGDMIAARHNDSLDAFNRAAFQQAGAPIGATVQNIGEQGAQELLGVPGSSGGKVGQAYDAATSGVTVPLDAQFGSDMVNARNAANLLPNDYLNNFNQAINNRVSPIAAAGQLTGDTYQQSMRGLKGYRSSADAAAPGFEQDYRDALSIAMDALRGQMERGGGQPVIEGLANADKSYKMAKILEAAKNAAKNGNNGEIQVFSPAQLNTAQTQTVAKFGGSRPFGDLADAGLQVLPSKVPDSGTARRLFTQGIIGGGALGAGAGLGYANGDAVAGAATPLAATALLALAGTRGGQNLMVKALLDRPDWAAKLGTGISKYAGQIGAAPIPLLIQNTR